MVLFKKYAKHFSLFLLLAAGICSVTLASAPHNLKAEVISSTQVKVSWEGSMNDKSYEIRRREAGTTFWTYNTVSAPSTNRRFTGLKPATTYEWEVQSIGDSKKDASGFLTGVPFTTFSNCELPDDYTVQYSGLNNATLNWSYGSNVEKYAVRVKAVSEENWKNYFTEYSSLTLNGLQPYTEYEWQVSSYCTATSNSGSAFSSSQYFSTESYLQLSLNQVMINRNTGVKKNEVISSAVHISAKNNYVKMINTMGQTVNQYPISYTDSSGDLFFDMNGKPPAGVYFIRVPVEMNTSGQKILVK